MRSHVKAHKKPLDLNQRTFRVADSCVVLEPKCCLALTPEDQVIKEEILQALHCTHQDYSFASVSSDNQRFILMFPESEITKNYQQSETKIKYSVQYDIAPYLKQKLIYDVKDKPFTFKFDETTNRNVSKQYDAYLQYWSKSYNQIVDAYCGSLFLGHCTSDNLNEYCKHFAKELNLDSNYLLHIGMDGPNVNLSFEKNY